MWSLLLKLKQNGDGTSTWAIEFNGETHSGITLVFIIPRKQAITKLF